MKSIIKSLFLLLLTLPLMGQNFSVNRLGKPLHQFHEDEQWQLIIREANSGGDVAASALRVSELFLGAPYKFSPLGEGEGNPPDEDPEFTTEFVDCLSLVEISLAAAYGKTKPKTLFYLRDIRYGSGVKSFENRNHFMMAQWITNNLRKGYVRDITELIGGEKVISAKKIYNEETWKKHRKGTDEEFPEANLPQGEFELKIIPLQHIQEFLNDIPAGAMMNIVKTDLPHKPYRVAHLGFVVVRNGKRYFRHAAKTFGKVVDVPLKEYLERLNEYQNWPVSGFNFLYPKPPAE